MRPTPLASLAVAVLAAVVATAAGSPIARSVTSPNVSSASPSTIRDDESDDPEPIRFRDITEAVGIDYTNVSGERPKDYILSTTGSGAAWLDFDRDGALDLYLTNGAPVAREDDGGLRVDDGPPNRLYRNVDDRFVPADAGVGDRGWAGGCAVADIDNDGFPDLVVTNMFDNRLYRNLGDGTFAEVELPGPSTWSASAAFSDLDGDGFVDLYVTNYIEFDWEDPPPPECSFLGIPVHCGPQGLEPAVDTLYRNRGDGTLQPWRQDFLDGPSYYGLGVMPVDVEGDGDMDLYVANDGTPNQLLLNDGTGTLTDEGMERGVALSGDGLPQDGMGVDAGDADGDGDPDLFVTNFSHETDTLYINFDGVAFVDETTGRGLAGPTLSVLGWATAFDDLDNDGDLDLLALNGHVMPQVDDHDLRTSYRQPPQAFLNRGDGAYREALWWVDGATAPPWAGRGAPFGDFDDDGDTDLFVVQIDDRGILLERQASRGSGHWLGLQLVGRSGNRDALGARITVRVPGAPDRVRWCETGGSYLSSNDPRIRVGLGAAEEAGEVEIAWPGGQVERLSSLESGRWYLVVEGRGVVATRGPGP